MSNTPAESPYREAPTQPNPPRPRRRGVLRALVAASALVVVAGVALRSRRDSGPADDGVPRALLSASGRSVLAPEELPPATPLAPLLDEPDALSLVSPPEGATRVARGAPLVFRFNRPMVRGADVRREVSDPPVTLTPPARGTWRWISRSSLAFEAETSEWDRSHESAIGVRAGVTSISGEALSDDTPRTAVFDGSPRLAASAVVSRVAAGRPLRLPFEGRVDATSLRGQMFAYEQGGGERALTFSLRPAGRDAQGRTLIDLTLARALEPGARVAVAFQPGLHRPWEGSTAPGVVTFDLEPRARVEGFACSATATSASQCSFQDRPGQVVDIAQEFRVFATRPVANATSPGALRVTPALPNLAVSAADQVVTVRGDWAPGQVYELRFGALVDANGQPLLPAPPLAVRSRGLDPAVVVRAGGLVYEPTADAVLPFSAVHTDQGAVVYRPVPRGQEIAALFDRTLVMPTTAGWSRRPIREWAPDARANHWARASLPWRSALDAGDLVLLGFDPDAQDDHGVSASLLQRTDLGVSAQVLPTGVLAWVTSVSGARAVEGAEVVVADSDGNTVGTARADREGLAWIAGAFDPSHGRYAVLARAGEQRAVIAVDGRGAARPGSFGISEEGRSIRDDAAGVIVTDRGAYRPGDRVRARALVRRVRGGGLDALRGGRWRLALHGPDGPVSEQVQRADRWGGLDAEFELPAGATPGDYTLELRAMQESDPLATQGVTVAMFRPPTMRVDVSVARAAVVDQGEVEARVSARLLAGAPLANAAMRWTLTREGAAERPARWDGWTFAPYDAAPRAGTEAEGDATVGADGTATIRARASHAAPTRERARLEVVVRDAAGQETRASETVTTYPADHEVALREGPAWVEGATPLTVEALATDHEGAPVAGKAIAATVYREGWHSYWQWAGGDAEEDGAWRPRRDRSREVAHRCALVSAADPVRCAWTPDRPGTYVIEVASSDAAGRRAVASRRVYVAAPGEHPDRDPPGAPVALTPQRPRWRVGETARLAFECPWPEAEALVTVVRDGVIRRERRHVTAGGATLEVPVTEAMLPNAFVTLTMVRPRTGAPRPIGTPDADAPDLRWGAAELGVDPRAGELHVELQTPQGPQRPETDLPLEVRVTDSDGRPARASVTLWGVDEGTLRLTRYATPDVLAGLRPRRAPAFALEDLRRELASRVAFPALPGASGDGDADGVADGSLVEVRDSFEPTALWAPHLEPTRAASRAP
ncbi:MAG: MG2 domain-containing protein [Polyangiales bacterium]